MKSNYKFSEYKWKQLHYLTPIAISDTPDSHGCEQWDFKCICGKIVTKPPYRVLSGGHRSCGCMRYKNSVRKGVPQGPHKVPRVDLSRYIGQKNNRLTVVDYVRREGKKAFELKCECECGNVVYVLPYQFVSGDVKSCGCIRGVMKTKHGLSHTKVYSEWKQMVDRCHNPKVHNYERYGGRGITVCEEWRKSPTAFSEWVESIGGKPEGMSLDRIDNNGPYAPWNCRFTTTKVQSRNKRSNRMYTYDGKTQCLADWAKELGISYSTLSGRLHKGWNIEKVLSMPVDKKQSHNKWTKAAL